MDSEGEDTEGRFRGNEDMSTDGMVTSKEPGDRRTEPCEEGMKLIQLRDGEIKAQNHILDSLSVTTEDVETESSVSGIVPVLPQSSELENPEVMEDSKMNYCDISDEKDNGILPFVHSPEKVILCFDLSEDQFYSSKFGDFNNKSTLSVIKQALEMFIHSKHMIDKRHEFAFVVVHQKAVWLQGFTNKPKDMVTVLSELTETPSPSFFCLSSLFDVIKDNVRLPSVEDPNIPPPYVVRAILIYSRSRCVPMFYDGKDSFQSLMCSKYFNFDYVIIHESLSPEGDISDEIASAFSEWTDEWKFSKPYSLKFHISRSATKLLDTMARLLSHPLQRYTTYNLKLALGDKSAMLKTNNIS